MVTTVTASTLPKSATGQGFDGVVRVSTGTSYGSGVLLWGGRAVLTAGHLISVDTSSVTVEFETTEGTHQIKASQIFVHEEFDVYGNNDLALLWLDVNAPVGATRYELYRQTDEIGQDFTMAGYGLTGSGDFGHDSKNSNTIFRQLAINSFDASADALKARMGSTMGWTPLQGTQLVADFDNGTYSNDALGQLMGLIDTGLGRQEGLISQGDSGGPAFIDGQIAGLATYVASLSMGSKYPDVDEDANSSYGEVGAWQRVSAYQQWIDQAVRARMTDAPKTPEQVKKTVTEGNSGTALVYFLLTLSGLRTDPDLWLSVDYTTRNGTALAGQDYLAVSGTAVLYPDEDHAVIAVEVLGDVVSESDEYFYLDVFNPVGAVFPSGQVTLTAMRTIVDNDGGWT